MNNSDKNINSEHKKLTKSDKEYIKGLIHNLALQRLTDQEITEHLQNKGMDIARSTVCTIRNKIEKESEKWYLELSGSRYRYLATYKERLDSLISYQKRLNRIVEFYSNNHSYPDTVIKAIAELHKIELSIFNIWKQLPIITFDHKQKHLMNPDHRHQVSSIQELQEEGLSQQPWDNGNDWYQCAKCQKWFKSELTDNCCYNCAELPPPIV